MIVLEPWSERWPSRFRELALDVREAAVAAGVAADQLTVEHIGSTSVPGLAAKPVVDMLVTAPDLAAVDRVVAQLRAAGWSYRPEHERVMPSRRFCHLDDAAGRRLANLHAWAAGDAEAERHLAFRDHLRAHADDRHAYERLKRHLAATTGEVQQYADAKTPFVERMLTRARPRELDLAIACPGGAEAPRAMLQPDGLARWLCSSVTCERDLLELVIEEEYGYRRRLRCRAVRPRRAASEELVLHVHEAVREWDGHVDAAGRTSAGGVFADALTGARLEVRREPGSLQMAWRDMPPDAYDVARREGAALLHCAGRARELVEGAEADPALLLQRHVHATPAQVWAVVAHPHGAPGWLGPSARLTAQPGLPWHVGTSRGSVHGRVLLAVAGRRLVASWHDPDAQVPAAVFELRLRGMGRGAGAAARTAIELRLDVAGTGTGARRAGERATDLIEAALDRLMDDVQQQEAHR